MCKGCGGYGTCRLTASADSVNEGVANTFTVKASAPVTADTVVTLQVNLGNGLAADQGTTTTNANDFGSGALNLITRTMLAGTDTVTFDVSTVADIITEQTETYSVEVKVGGVALPVKTINVLDGAVGAGQTFTLTKDIDTIPGLKGSLNTTSNTGDDIIEGVIGTVTVGGTGVVSVPTLSALDNIDGGAGTNVLNAYDQEGNIALANMNVKNVQTVNLKSVGVANADLTTGFTGVTAFNVTQGTSATVKAAATTAISATGLTGTAGVKEVFELNLDDALDVDSTVDDTEIVFDGVTVNLTDNDTEAEVATALAGTAWTNWDAAIKAGTTDVVVFTAKTAGTKTDTVIGDFTFTPGTNADTSFTGAVTVTTQGVTGTVTTVDGGSSQTVSIAKGGATVGATTVTTGAISVTTADQGIDTIAVDGGAAVTVNTTGSTGGAVTVGQGGAAADLATGVVSVTSNHKAVAATDVTLGAITVTGGSTVTVAQTADTSKAAADTTGATLTQGAVSVTAGTTTTSVTVNQAKSTTEVTAVTAVAGVTETATVKFGALKSGDSIILGTTAANDTLAANELQFTAAKDLTAEEVAQAFASLTAADFQAGGKVVNGVYSVHSGLTTLPWTSGAASGDTVVFTSTTANTAVDNLVVDLVNTSTNSVDATVTYSAVGSGATAARTGVLGVQTGAVTIEDNATAASITTVSLDGYGATAIGGTNTLSKLATLNLSNSGSTGTAGETDAAVTVDAAGVTTLALGLNNVNGAVNLDSSGTASVATLNVTTSGADSSFALTAAAVKTLTIAGDKKATLSSGTFTALETLTVSGSASAVFDSDEADTLTSVNTSATTGAVTVGINGTKATYTGGAGVDTVTLVTGTSLTKAIDLGAGDDTLSFGAITVTASTAALNGGDGTDTLVMNTTAAAALDDATQTFYTNFERLTISDTSTATLNLANLGFTNYVTTTGSGGTLTLNNLASNGTVVLTADATTGYTVGVKDATTGTADVLNVQLVKNGVLAAGVLTAAKVETINLTVTDSNTTDGISTHTLTLTADKATTVNVTGNAGLSLTLTTSPEVTLVDASTMTAGLALTANGATAGTEVRGGSGNDTLTASGENDVLKGNGGNDTFNLTELTSAYGGDGADKFYFAAIGNLTKVSKVYEVGSGDVFYLVDQAASAAVDKFYSAGAQYNPDTTTDVAGKVNAALVQTAEGEASWFNHGGNTYVVIDGTDNGKAAGAEDTLQAGTDIVIQIIGEFNLGTGAAFNNVSGTLEFL